MKYGVITRVPTPESGGNMAVSFVVYELAGEGIECRPIPIMDQLYLRTPVFMPGEILVCGGDGREVAGLLRKPEKWDVDVEWFDSIDEAVIRATSLDEEE